MRGVQNLSQASLELISAHAALSRWLTALQRSRKFLLKKPATAWASFDERTRVSNELIIPFRQDSTGID